MVSCRSCSFGWSALARLLPQRFVDRSQQCSRRVAGVIPEHPPAESMLQHIITLRGERLRIFVRYKNLLLLTIEIRHRSDRIPVPSKPMVQHGLRDETVRSITLRYRLACLKQSMIVVCYLTPHVAVKGQPEKDLGRGYPTPFKREHRCLSRYLLRIRCVRKQRRMMACGRIGARFVVVVSHQIDRINVPLNLCHLGMIEILIRSSRRNREVEPPVTPFRLPTESLSQLFEQQSKILLVFSAEGVAGSDHARIFPVDIETIEIIAGEKVHNTLDKERPALRRQRDVGEVGRPEPSANRDENRERRILPLETGKECEVPGIFSEAGDHTAILDIGEGIVNGGQAEGINLPWLKGSVLREDITHYHRGGRPDSCSRAKRWNSKGDAEGNEADSGQGTLPK